MANTYYKLTVLNELDKPVRLSEIANMFKTEEEAKKCAKKLKIENYSIDPITMYNYYTVYFKFIGDRIREGAHPRCGLHILRSESDRLLVPQTSFDNAIGLVRVYFTNEDIDRDDDEAIDDYARKILEEKINKFSDYNYRRNIMRTLTGRQPATTLDIENYMEYGKEAEAVYGKISKEFKEDFQNLTKTITRKQYEDLESFDLLVDAILYEKNYKSEHKEEEITVSYFTSDTMYHVLKRIK